jgi:hypothetical protein
MDSWRPHRSAPTASLRWSRRAIVRAAGVVVALACLGSAAALAESGDPERFRVVVNRANPASTAPRDFLEGAFLKKISRWTDGESIQPVDQPPSSTVRRSFSKSVLRRSVDVVRNYWLQRIFAGRSTPPPELGSDEAVMRYVAKYRGAIGYVSSSTELVDVKVIGIR